MDASLGDRPDGPQSGVRPALAGRRAALWTPLLSAPAAAFAAGPGVGPSDQLSIVLGGFAFVGALVFVFMRMRHSRRGRGGDKGVVGAIDHVIDGDGDGDSGGGDGRGGGD